jgi:murein L,D-transpeptidase YafK
VGVYHITGWMSDASLPELYGTGALPLDYPNLWDRLKSKTGYGIWLHGVPRQTYVRGPRSSEGCVTLANDDLLWLKQFVLRSRAPVVLADELQWVPQHELQQARETILRRIEDWRRTWASRDTDALLGFYSQDLGDGGLSRAQFVPARTRPAAKVESAGVTLSDLSLFQYPGEPMLLAEFKVEYRDEDRHYTSRKEQYWRRDAGGQWRIFREENR